MRKKLIGLSIATALGIMSLTACKSQPAENASTNGAADTTAQAEGTKEEGTSKEASGDRVKLEIWDWWGDGQYKYVIEQLCQNFNESQDT